MKAEALRALLLTVILVIGVMRIREDHPWLAVRLLRAELALTVLALLSALVSSLPGQRRAALLAAILATAAQAGVLPRLLGQSRAEPARRNSASRGLIAVAAVLLLVGWTFASVHAESELIPSGIERRQIALAVSVLLVAVLGLPIRASDPWTMLCRLASLGNAVLLLASVIPNSSAPALIASLCLMPVVLLAAVLLPRLAIADTGPDGPPAP